MRSLAWLTPFLSLTLAPAEAPNPAKEELAIRAKMRTACQALEKADAELLGSVLSHSGRFRVLDPERVYRGFTEFDASVREWFKTTRVSQAWYEEVKINVSAAADMAWYTGTLRIEGTDREGPFHWTIREIGVFEKQNGRWVYAAWAEHHESPAQAGRNR